MSTWFRDYVYIPLGGSKGGMWMKIRNTFIIFLLSGFWHGANWTFIVWGALNALYFMPLLIFGKNRDNIEIVAQGRYLPTWKELMSMIITFGLTVFAWIFFRAESVSQAFAIVGEIFSASTLSMPKEVPYMLLPLLAIFLAVEWLGRENKYAIEKFFFERSRVLRWGFYYSIAMIIFLFAGKEQQFIYFQF